MQDVDIFDTIIVGGGPAGLAVASELSARCKVLVLEKGLVGETHRFWFVPPDAGREDQALLLWRGDPLHDQDLQHARRRPGLAGQAVQQLPLHPRQGEYYRILRQEASTADFHNLAVTSERWGWYPSGGLSQQIAEERVAFAGNAACWSTPCGWGMTFILENYRHFAEQIGDCLDNDTLDRESLLDASQYRLHGKFEIMTNVLASRTNWTASSVFS